jgi:hypothetical protein
MIILRYEAINESGGVHTYKIHGDGGHRIRIFEAIEYVDLKVECNYNTCDLFLPYISWDHGATSY